MAQRDLTIKLSGKTYDAACDPNASDVPTEENWPRPHMSRVGRGWRAEYPWTDELAEKIASHLECIANGFAYSDDASTRAEGRACSRDAVRIRAQMSECI